MYGKTVLVPSILQNRLMMHKKFIVLSFLLCGFIFPSCSAKPAIADPGKLKPLPEHTVIAQTLTKAIEIYHYKKPKLNDSLSSVIFDRYFKDLDPNRMYFLQTDLDEFTPFRTQLSAFLENGDMSVPFAIYNRWLDRQHNRFNFVLNLLNKTADAPKSESFQFNREKAGWIKDSLQLNTYWRNRLLFDRLSLGLAQKDQEKNTATLKKRYLNLNKQLGKVNSEDAFKAFMDAFAFSIDPHTTYFSPQGKADFNIDMAKSLEGIGALLGSENEYIKIAQLTKGGPAEKSKKLFPNDRVIAVAQGKTGEFTDIIGWRTDEAVGLIRGSKGTIVRLKIMSANASSATLPHIVELVREKINLNDQRASSNVKEIDRDGHKYRIGVITLGDFYMDFEAASRGVKNYNSTSRDVRRILDSLKLVKVDGVVLDLRNNGGGSLKEAIDLTGLFITQGPVVQVKDFKGGIEVDSDKDPEEVYKGPFAVLINNFSASASEIFAGAIQDYGRGVIIGEQSYGKGTVQTAFNINDMIPNLDKKLGQFNMTVFKFYRINGSSTQRKGVVPDILYPSKFPSEKFGESSEPSALPWDMIASSKFQMMGDVPAEKNTLVQNHSKRMQNNPFYQEWLDDIADFKETMAKTTVILNSDSLKHTQDLESKKDLARYNTLRLLNGLKPMPVVADNVKQTEGPDPKTAIGAHPASNSRLAIDPELLIKLESYQVIADMVELAKGARVSMVK